LDIAAGKAANATIVEVDGDEEDEEDEEDDNHDDEDETALAEAGAEGKTGCKLDA
jgi:hypothetical protein